MNDFEHQQWELPDIKKSIKSKIRSDFGKISVILLLLYIAANILSVVIGICVLATQLIFYAPNSLSSGDMYRYAMEYLGSNNPMLMFLIAMLPFLLADIFCIVFARFSLKLSFKRDLFCPIGGDGAFKGISIIACLGAGLLGSMLTMILMLILESMNIKIGSASLSMPKDNLLASVLFFAYICFLGPICEEILFRGFILKTLQKHGNLFAVITSSLLFCMFHFNPVQIFTPILIGLILGLMTVYCKSIIPATIAHILNNTLVIVMSMLFPEEFPTSMAILVSVLYFFITVIFFIIFLVKYSGMYKKLDPVHEGEAVVYTTNQKIRIAFSSPAAIIYLGLYIFMIGVTFFASSLI